MRPEAFRLMESNFALFKRAIAGSFHWNERKRSDADRMVKTIVRSNTGRLMQEQQIRRRA
jgi:hypothetical protein